MIIPCCLYYGLNIIDGHFNPLDKLLSYYNIQIEIYDVVVIYAVHDQVSLFFSCY